MTSFAAPLRSPTIPGPDPDTSAPKFKLPPGACDCHAHVFGPQQRFPYAPNAGYIAPDALPADYVRMLRTLGCERAVLVQPSVYATDNSAMLEAMCSGVFAFRGVAVVNEDINDRELEHMHRAGVRGVRINLASATPGLTLEQAPRLAPRLKALGWHLQFFMDLKMLPDAAALLSKLDIDIVIDHFGRVRADDGLTAPPFQILLALLSQDNCWAKLIGPYFLSDRKPRFPDVTPFARAVVAAAPERVVWGTDWPHPSSHGMMPNDGDLADMLLDWIPDEAQRRKVLVSNPARLYDF
ncbi:MAG: amidohydrolase family protein [Pseudomonadota bacterium]